MTYTGFYLHDYFKKKMVIEITLLDWKDIGSPYSINKH